MALYTKILKPAQRVALKGLGPAASARGFYLGGGTAIALQLGHRRSDDFDWFTAQRIDATDRLAADIQQSGISFIIGEFAPGTLHGTVSGVRTSFFEYGYPLLGELLRIPDLGCDLASLDDLAAMKLAAIAQRGSRKDFLDVYAIGLKHASLERMIELLQLKYSISDPGHALFSLAYFDDADQEPMPKLMWSVDWEEVKKAIRNWLTGYDRSRRPSGLSSAGG